MTGSEQYIVFFTIQNLFVRSFQVREIATGECTETMTTKTWDVAAYKGKRAQVKLVDKSSDAWGHINFDDLRGDISCN